MPVEFVQLFVGHAAVRQDGLYLGLVQDHGFRRFFVLLDQFREPLVDVLHHLDAAVLPQGILDQCLEGLLLVSGGQGQRAAEELVHEALLEFLRVLGIVEQAVDVRAAVVEGGEQEAPVR